MRMFNLEDDTAIIKSQEFNYDLELENLSKYNRLSTLPILFCLCLSRKDERKEYFIDKITKLFRNFQSNDYAYVYKLFRGHKISDNIFDWKKVTMDMILEDNMTLEEKINILGLASFHRSGYIRERAVKELIKYSSNQILPFIIIRVNDLIDSIRNIANDALLNKITIHNFEHILRNIKLIDRLKLSKYRNNKDIYNKIEEIFKCDNVENKLKDSAFNRDKYVQEYCLENIINRELLGYKEIVELACNISSASVRAKMVGLILQRLTNKEFLECKDILLRCKGSKVQILIVEKLHSIEFYKSAEELKKYTLSKYAAVRYLARNYINEFGKYNFVKLYLRYLNTEDYKDSAILGLCEVGTVNELEVIKSFLNYNKSSIKKKVLKTIANLDFCNESKTIIEALKSDKVGIAKIARKILMENKDLFDEDEIYDMYKNSDNEVLALNAAIVLCSMGKWKAISYIIEIMGNSNSKIASIGEVALEKWFSKSNYIFTKPQKKNVERLNVMLSIYGVRVKEDKRKELEFMIKY